jgi:hypothetical protein
MTAGKSGWQSDMLTRAEAVSALYFAVELVKFVLDTRWKGNKS